MPGSPRRIVLFYKTLVNTGGAERLMIQEWIHLRRLGHEPKILTFEVDPKALYGAGERIDVDLYVCRGSTWFAKIHQAWRFLRDFECDVIILTSGAIELFFLTRLLPIPYLAHHHQPSSMANESYDKYASVLREHFEWLCQRTADSAKFRAWKKQRNWRQKFSHEVRGRIYKAVLDRANLILVMSEYAKEEAERLFAAPVANLQGALDTDTVIRYRAVAPFEGTGEPLLLTVARLAADKRIDVAIRAFAELTRRHPDARYVIVGEGAERGKLEKLIEDLALQDRCRMLGYVEEDVLERWYKSCDVFVTVDWADFRLTAFEAWATGKPVILADEAEVNADIAATGYAIKTPAVPERVADAMEMALQARARLDPGKLAAVLENYTWKAYVKAVAERLP